MPYISSYSPQIMESTSTADQMNSGLLNEELNYRVLFLIAHMLNQGVTQMYLMRNKCRARIFTGSASMITRKVCITTYCSTLMRA